MGSVRPIAGKEEVGIKESSNRVLAQDIEAKIDVPSFDRAAMDGYAVIAEDTFGADQFNPRVLTVAGRIHAGDVSDLALTGGECAEIATGAMIPAGADAVVMIEDTEKQDDNARVFKPVYPGANLSKKGSDISKGTVILREGDVLNPSRIGVLASLGMDRVKVYRKPRVAIIPTGNEVAEIGGALGEGQVYNSNSYALESIALENGADVARMDIVEDTQEALRSVISKARENDLIVLSGGSSVGERDVLVDVVSGMGKLLFHGVQVKPGKPLLLGEVEGKLILGTPGYPTACIIDGYVFMAPIIRKMARLPEANRERVKARISRRVVSTLGRQQFLTVRIEGGQAIPVFKESGAITSMAAADGYIEIPANVDMVEKDDEIEVVLFKR